MRTVYLGTSEFAATVLARLAESPHRPNLVVSRPDRPRGRGRKLAPPPVADAARALGIPVIQPERLDAEEVLAGDPEAICLCAYGAIVREPLLSARPILNVHPSLLPRWRGAAPVERAILAGDGQTGVSIMRLVEGLDAGPVALREAVPIGPEDTYGDLASRLAELGGELLVRALDAEPAWREQPAAGVTYAEKIESGDRELRPGEEDPEQLVRRVRALTPHIGAWIAWEGERLGVRAARVGEDGALELLEVQPPGGRPMPFADYVRGRR